ncbi:MAG TPA: SHOCT domain-containing protein [Methanothrix sp.]|nr:SHOCT domain-containing protein [Methanothrix sp.]HOK58712.1 SHOCT domain-containing protein [Methanothrix sp.]HOL43884.1 SHOCT domain-containing protein [Methanothrix sp.]HPO88948.1 SHOCT domain-containing protein [Methanothrix sp.]
MISYHMMDWGPMWWGTWGVFPIIWMIGYWLVFLAIAYLVYRDAESRGMNGLMWAILVVLPWIGILFLIVYLLKRDEVSGRSAESILDERYARGELTRDEYLRMKEDLRRGRE